MGTAVVRRMVGDFWLPLRVLAPTVGFPLQGIVIEPLDLFYAFHELGELLELLPLIIGSLYRHAHINGCFNGRHAVFLILKMSPWYGSYALGSGSLQGAGRSDSAKLFSSIFASIRSPTLIFSVLIVVLSARKLISFPSSPLTK